MFISAGLHLKLHTTSNGVVETHTPTYPPSTSKIIRVSIGNDNTYLAVLRENEKPQIFSTKDPQNARLIHTINVSNITALTFKRSTKKHIALGTNTGDVVMYDTKTRTMYNLHAKVTEFVKFLEFTCEDRQLCGIDGNILFVFPDLNNMGHLKRFKQKSEVTSMRCHPFIPDRVGLGCSNGCVSLWDVLDGIELVTIESQHWPISSIAMSSCGNFLIIAGKELKICSLDMGMGTCSCQYKLEQEQIVTACDLSADDKSLIIALTDGTLKLYDLKDNIKLIFSSVVHNSQINILMFENKAKEATISNFSSVMRLPEEVKEPEPEVSSRSRGILKPRDPKEEALERMKRSLMKVIKNEMDSLETQLLEHCAKFQKFLDNEFETIDAIIKKKWNVFNAGDMNQIITAICPDDSKTSCN